MTKSILLIFYPIAYKLTARYFWETLNLAFTKTEYFEQNSVKICWIWAYECSCVV